MTAGDGDGDAARQLSPERRELLARLRQRADDAVLSCAQERFWFLEQLEPGNAAHHVAGRTTLRGPLDPDLFERAVALVVARHEALRTVFPSRNGQPGAVILPPSSPPLPRHDLRALAAEPRAQERDRFARDLVLAPFDLQSGPLLRQSLLRLADDVHEHLWCLHHVAVDGTSMLLLARDLAATYAQLRRGAAPALPAPPSYRAFAQQQRRWLATPAAERMAADWEQALRGLEPLEVPADFEPPQARHGARQAIDLPGAAALLAAASGLGLTPFMLFASGLGLLLRKLGARDDLGLGFPVLGRDEQHRAAVGLFVNSLVLRLQGSAAMTFRSFAAQVRQQCLWAYDRQAMPFERLVERLAPERHPTRHPLFQVLLNYVDFDLPSAQLGDLEQSYEPLPAGTLLDLVLWVRRKGDAVRLEFEFDAGRRRAATVAAWLEGLVALLTAAVAAPDTPIGRLPLLTLAQQERVRALGRGVPLPPQPHHTVHDRVLAQCARTPGRRAVVCGDRVCSYAELAARVLHMARALQGAGLQHGDRIAVLVDRDERLVALLLAIAAAGGTFVPIEPEHPPLRRAAILADARPQLLVHDGTAPPPAPPGCRVLALAALAAAAGDGAAAPLAPVDPDQPAYLLYTSGTTGAPKGVLVPHRALAAFLAAFAATPGFAADDAILAATTIGFDIALLELLLPLCVGGAVHVAPAAAVGDPVALARLLADARVTVFQATPTTWRLLWRDGYAGRPTLRALVGGEALPPDLAAFLHTRCSSATNLYGPTETTIWSLAWSIDAGPVAIGRPLPGTFVRVVDADGGALPPHSPGELAIGGAGVALGHFGDDRRTAERFVADPLGDGRVYRTGDRVRARPDGTFDYLGRVDEQWKLHGQRIEPGEIEAALRAHAEVADAAVDLRGSGDGRRLCAWIVARGAPAGDLAAAQLERWQAVWRATYDDAPPDSSDPTFDRAGWRDSVHNQPFDKGALRAWRDGIVAALRERSPRRVLEVGCGTGLLLWELAPQCERYVGIEPVPDLVQRLGATAAARSLAQVKLLRARADELDTVLPAAPAFDLAILNSVAQYLPDLDHLLAVVDALAARLQPGGALFLGDLRVLPLQRALHTSVVLAQADDRTPVAELQARLQARLRHDQELAIDPALFHALGALHPRLGDVRCELHRSPHDDELTRFRANVWLFADRAPGPAPRAVPATTLEQIGPALEAGDAVRIVGLADRRSAPWVRAADRLGDAPDGTAADLRQVVAVATAELQAAPDLAALQALARSSGRALVLSPGASPGTLDALFAARRAPTASAMPTRPPWNRAAFAQRHAALASTPLRAGAERALGEALRTHLRLHLPTAAIPQLYQLVDALPRSANGKLRRVALPEPTANVGAEHVVAAPGREAAVAAIFARVLGRERVSALDDFFALGGHSLLAAQVVALCRSELGVELPLRTLFATPSVRALAARLQPGSAVAPVAVPPLQTFDDRLPLAAHERLWFLHRLEPQSAAYHLAGHVAIDGAVPAAVVRRALELVVARHELLRLRVDGDRAAPRLLPAEPAFVFETGQLDAWLAALGERARCPFDLGAEAPLRVFVHLGTGTQVLLVLHHAAADGWSLQVLARDLAAAIAAVAGGQLPEWPELPFLPSAFAAHERALLAGDATAPLRAYWRAALQHAPGLDLPTDRPRPARQDLRGERFESPLPPPLWHALCEGAVRAQATAFQAFFALTSGWLARLVGTDDLVVGTVVSGREHPGLRDQVGCFVNLLPVRVRVAAAATSAMLLAHVREALLAAQEHAGLPFAQLLRELDPPRDLSRPPLAQVTIELLEPLPEPAPLLGHAVTLREVPTSTSKFELTLRLCTARDGSARLQVEYASALFDAATIADWVESLLTFLTAALALPAAPLGDLAMVDAAALRAQLELGSGPPTAPPLALAPGARTFVHAFAAVALARPDADAVAWAGGTLTYRALQARAAALATALRALDLPPQTIVAVAAARGPDLLPALLGVMQAGLAWLPLDPDDPPARRVQLARAAGARAHVGDDAELTAAGIRSVAVPKAVHAPDPARELLRGPGPVDPAYVLFTSGSTGLPKAVVVPHRALLHYLQVAAARYLDDAGGALVATAVTFDLTLTCLFAPLLRGMTVHLAPPGQGLEPWSLARAREPYALCKLTPSHLRAFAAAAAQPPRARTYVVGGETLLAADAAPLLAMGARVVNEYGPTEATVGCTAAEVTGESDGALPIGTPLPGVRAYVLDQRLEPLPRGAIGELCIGGAALADGYLGDAALTAQQFVADPWQAGGRIYRTGDRARWQRDGQLAFCGRSDAQVKVLGVRVEPAEVAAALRALPGVTDVAVAAIAAPGGGVQLGAWVVAEGQDPADLARALEPRLPVALRPRFVQTVAAIPLTRHGKADVRALPLPGRTATATEAPTAAAAVLQARMAALLRTDVAVDDDFFVLGGDSILALQLVAQAASERLRLAVRDVFEHRTARALARVAVAIPAVVTVPPPAELPAQTPLLPIQLQWLQHTFADPHHDVQAVVCRLSRPCTAAALQRAFAAVAAVHPLLTSRLNGEPPQLVAGGPPIEVASAVAADLDALRERLLQQNGSLDPRRGRMVNALLAETGAGHFLHIAVHHLAIDAVSWRPMLFDLDAALAGSALAPATPFAQFAHRLRERAAQGEFADERAFWAAQTPAPARGVAPWPPATRGAAAELASDGVLPADWRQALAARHASAFECVVAAVAQALAEASGAAASFALERHGRDDPALDLSRTIGWMTAVHPLRVVAPPHAVASDWLRAAKAALRAVPGGGVGYGALVAFAGLPAAPAPGLQLNYLGDLDLPAGQWLEATDLDPGPLRSPRRAQPHALELDLWCRGGALHARVRVAAGFDAMAVRSWLAQLPSRVVAMAACDAAACLLPADFPHAQLDDEALARLVADEAPEDLFPLTSTQHGMLVHALQEPASAAYTEQLVHEFEGDLDGAALASALHLLQQRHALLRAGMAWRELDTPHWVVAATLPLPLRQRVAPQDAAAAFLRRFAAADRRAGFDLARAPLWRCTHVAMPARRHALVFTYHHSLLDGWSMPLLLGELVRAYAAACAGSAPALPPARPYRDHVVWLRRQDLTAARAFWRASLAGCAAPTPLGIDRGAAVDRAAAAHAECERFLDAGLGPRLQELQRACGATSGTLALAATALWLARASGSDDVVFGLTVNGRSTELDDAATRIGLFINTIPVRAQLHGDERVRDWLRRLMQEQAATLPWQWTPLPQSQAQADAEPGRPLFDLLLVHENYPLDQALQQAPPGLRTIATWTNERTSYPLTLVVIPGARWLVRVLYAQGRIDGDAARRMLQQFERALAAMAAAPDRRVGDLQLLDDGDRALARRAGPPPLPLPVPHCGAFVGLVARRGALPVLLDRGVAVSGQDLAARATVVAQALRARGLRRGDIVALRAARGAPQIAALLGIWQAGAAVAPLDPAWPADYARDLATRARCALALDDRADADLGCPALDLRALGTAPAPMPTTGAAPAVEAADGDDVAAVMFTSGSTGVAKAVELRHRSLCHYAGAARARFALTAQDRVLQFASLAFDAAFEELLPALVAGSVIVLRDDDLDPQTLLDRCARDGVTVLDLPTAYFHALAAYLEARDLHLPPALRLCILGGEAARAHAAAALLARHPRLELWNTYGPTEATVVATWCRILAADAERGDPLPIGTPVPGAIASVRDQHGRLVIPGAVGELWLAGVGLALGYRGDAAATAAHFAPSPDAESERCYRTGDLARWRADGSLEFCGRADRQLKVRGQRVEPLQIEGVLAAHPDVAIAAVVVRTHGDDGARLHAFAVPRAGRTPAAEQLRAFLRMRLPAAAVPVTVQLCADLPRTVQGKVDHAALLARQAAVAAAPDVRGDPATPDGLLGAVTAAFTAVLGAEASADDDFFALGGDSLAAIRLLDAIRLRTGRDVALAQVFGGPTPRALAAHLRAGAPQRSVASHGDAIPAADLLLADGLRPAERPPRRARARVLLTGGGGFLGGAVLTALLARTDAQVVVLQRRKAALPADPRVQALAGRIDRERLGLDAATFAALARDLDAVYHVAANTNVWLPYTALRADNVDGTRHVLELCAAGGAHLHHVSTAGVFDAADLADGAVVDEDSDVARLRSVRGGYAASKWVAEQLVAAAAARGLRATIYRPGRLAAGNDGVLPRRDLGLGLFALCIELGCAPDLDLAVDLTPVDWAAHALVELSARPDAAGRRWHLLQQQPQRLSELWQLLDELGVPLRRVPFAHWLQTVTGHLARAPRHPQAPLLQLLRPAAGMATGALVRSEHTHAALAGCELPPAQIAAATLLTALERLDAATASHPY